MYQMMYYFILFLLFVAKASTQVTLTGQIKYIEGTYSACIYFNDGLALGGCGSHDINKWSFQPTPSGYILKNIGSCIGVYEDKIIQLECERIPSRLTIWSIRHIADPNKFFIRSDANGKCLFKSGDLIKLDNCSKATTFTLPFNAPNAPYYNRASIPLTPNAYLDANSPTLNKLAMGVNVTVAGYTLLYTIKCILTISNLTSTLWQSVPAANCLPGANPSLNLGTDGNMCTYLSNRGWCSYSHGLGGRYLNFLTPGSYGKEWGLVIQTSTGQMVWGIFGPSVVYDAPYAMIPGSFIAIGQNLTSTYLSNGRDYLTLGSDAILRYYMNNPTDGNVHIISPILWTSHNVTTAPITIPGPFYAAIQPNFDALKFCIFSRTVQTPIWCLSVPSSTYYVQIPTPLDSTNSNQWGFVFKDKNLNIVGGLFNTNQSSLSCTSTPSDNFIITDGKSNLKFDKYGYMVSLQPYKLWNGEHVVVKGSTLNNPGYYWQWDTNNDLIIKDPLGKVNKRLVVDQKNVVIDLKSSTKIAIIPGIPEMFIINGRGVSIYNTPLY